MKLDEVAPCMPIVAALPAALTAAGYTYANCEIDYPTSDTGYICYVRVHAVAPGTATAQHVGTISARFTNLRGDPDRHNYVDAGVQAFANNNVLAALNAACQADARVVRYRALRLASLRRQGANQ